MRLSSLWASHALRLTLSDGVRLASLFAALAVACSSGGGGADGGVGTGGAPADGSGGRTTGGSSSDGGAAASGGAIGGAGGGATGATGGAGGGPSAGSGGAAAQTGGAVTGGAGTGGEPEPLPPTFRVVLVADTHVIGPQYECCSESEGVDNESIMKTEDRLVALRDTVNAIEPPPDLVFILGDVSHDAYSSRELEWYESSDNAFTRARDVLAGFDMPVHLALGNHDYHAKCGNPTDSWERDFSNQLFEDLWGTPPYHAVDHRGWRFVLANSQLGPTWDIDDPECDTGTASYGRTQLAWIADQLDDDIPTMVMFHYPSIVTATDEDPDGPVAGLFELLDDSEALVASFAGHTHRWLDFSIGRGAPHYVVASSRYDADNFWLLELEGEGTEWQILDEGKAKWLSTCSHTYTYDGIPTRDRDAEELGDCAVLP